MIHREQMAVSKYRFEIGESLDIRIKQIMNANWIHHTNA